MNLSLPKFGKFWQKLPLHFRLDKTPMVKETDGPRVRSNGPRDKCDPEFAFHEVLIILKQFS